MISIIFAQIYHCLTEMVIKVGTSGLGKFLPGDELKNGKQVGVLYDGEKDHQHSTPQSESEKEYSHQVPLFPHPMLPTH